MFYKEIDLNYQVKNDGQFFSQKTDLIMKNSFRVKGS